MIKNTNDDSLYLAIDQGGHASRALVFNGQGGVVASAYCNIQTLTAPGERVEHDPAELIASIRQVCEQVVHKLDDAQRLQLVAAGLATQRSSLIAWQPDGKPLTPVISWQDRRAFREMDWLLEHEQAVREKTGLRVNPHYGASKIHWLMAHQPTVAQAAASGELLLGPVASYILFHLLDEQPFVVDPSNASRTMLMNVHTRQWDRELLRWTGIEASLLPQIHPTRCQWGHLTVGDIQLPLIACNGDQSAALYAQGEPLADSCYINAGTGAFMLQKTSGEKVPGRLLHSVVFCNDRGCDQVVEGTVNAAARALDAVAEEYRIEDWPSKLDLAIQLRGDQCVHINGMAGVGSPWWRSEVSTAFIPEPKTELARLQAVVEGVLFLIYANFQEISHLRRSRIVLSGGLAASDGFAAALASLCGVPVERPELFEATGRGLVWQMLGKQADWRLPASEFLPDDSQAAELKRKYRVWLEHMPPVSDHQDSHSPNPKDC